MATGINAQKHEQRMYFGRDPEVTYGAGASLTHFLNPTSGIPQFRRGRNMKNNADQSTGKLGPTVTTPLEYFLGPSQVGFYADPRALGIFIGHLFGADTVTNPATGAYVHSFAQAASGVFPGSFACAPKLRAGVTSSSDRYYSGCYIENLTISGGNTDFVSITPTISGSGDGNTASVPASDGSLIGPTATFVGFRAQISIKPVATAGTSVWDGTYTPQTAPSSFANTLSSGGAIVLGSEGLESWTLTMNANYEQGSKLRPGNGPYQVCPRPGRPTFSLNVQADSTPEIRDALVYKYEDDQQQYSVALELSSDVEIASSGRYYNFANFLPVAQIMSLAPDDGEQVKEGLTWEAYSPSAGSVTDMCAPFLTDDDSNDWGGA